MKILVSRETSTGREKNLVYKLAGLARSPRVLCCALSFSNGLYLDLVLEWRLGIVPLVPEKAKI